MDCAFVYLVRLLSVECLQPRRNRSPGGGQIVRGLAAAAELRRGVHPVQRRGLSCDEKTGQREDAGEKLSGNERPGGWFGGCGQCGGRLVCFGPLAETIFAHRNAFQVVVSRNAHLWKST